MEQTIAEFREHCDFKQQRQLNKPLSAPREATHKTNVQAPLLTKPKNEKSFNAQEVVSPGIYQLSFKSSNQTQNVKSINLTTTTNTTTSSTSTTHTNNSKRDLTEGVGIENHNKTVHEVASLNLEKFKQLLPYNTKKHNSINQSLILNSVENFQILPKPLSKLGASDETETQVKQQPESELRKGSSSTEGSNKAQNVLEASAHLKPAINATASSSSSNLPPLAQPPNQHKPLPEMVAPPVPAADFEQLVRNENAAADKVQNPAAIEDIDAAVEELPKNENENNRYANVHGDEGKDMANKAAAAGNEDSGAHEIKDHDFINDANFNLPAENNNNMFGKQIAAPADNNEANVSNNKHKKHNNEDIEDDERAPEDIAVKNLDDDNLNNELLGDQGKEFEGLHLEDGNDEDGDGNEFIIL